MDVKSHWVLQHPLVKKGVLPQIDERAGMTDGAVKTMVSFLMKFKDLLTVVSQSDNKFHCVHARLKEYPSMAVQMS